MIDAMKKRLIVLACVLALAACEGPVAPKPHADKAAGSKMNRELKAQMARLDVQAVEMELASAGVLTFATGPDTLRFVTHHDVDDAMVRRWRKECAPYHRYKRFGRFFERRDR